MDEQKQQQNDTSRAQTASRKGIRFSIIALICGVGLTLFVFLIPNPSIPTASAHAVLVRSDPAANALLHTPPTHVRLWFDDMLIAETSHVIVQNAEGQEVDRRDSAVSHTDPREMTVTLPGLPVGTYTVQWVAQSADDGHVTSGSFTFSIVGAHGVVPPETQGSATLLNGVTLDGPTVMQTLATWLALLLMSFWLGGLFWETWIFPPGAAYDPAVVSITLLAARRFVRWLPSLLVALLLANIVIVIGQEAELTGSWSGAFTPSLVQALLFGSRFGVFWWICQGTLLAALGLTLTAERRHWSMERPALSSATAPSSVPSREDVSFQWWHTGLSILRGIAHVPAQSLAGWRRRSWCGRLELFLGALFLVAYAFSGHAAAVPDSVLGYAVSVDVLHLLGNVIWVGGLLYITGMILPLLRQFEMRQHARILAAGLPSFSGFAIISVIVLSFTGPLNATIRLTSWQQLVTTLYGWTLTIKIELFLVMVAISIYHACYLRPQLTRELNTPAEGALPVPEQTPIEVVAHNERRPVSAAETMNKGAIAMTSHQDEADISERAERLAGRLEGWLRREAILGVAVLLCVALLGAFAGTLAPAI
ncbi:MAG: copper resistance CopC/CopD family protein [Ktedonobacteraceae bacterium]